MVKFITLRLGSYKVLHGYDASNREITEEVKVEGYADKVIAVSRIKSISDKYVLTDYADGRWIYWEYEGGMQTLILRMEAAGVLISQ
jgi:hypothetical protein